MKHKLKNRVLRTLRPAIEICERTYDCVRDAEPELEDRQDTLDQLGKAIVWLVMALARLRDDLHETVEAEAAEARFPP